MNYLHTLKPAVVHRDLKSLNILVNDYYMIKVSAFLVIPQSSGNWSRFTSASRFFHRVFLFGIAVGIRETS